MEEFAKQVTTKHEKSAGAIIYYLENNKPIFLLLQNTLKKTYWEFPKGKIEKNEAILSTVKREVKEETNLNNINIIHGFRHILTWYFRLHGQTIRKEAVFLLASIQKEDKEKVKIGKEHQLFAWMDFDRAMREINIKSNREMLKQAFDFIKKLEKQKKLP